MVMYEDEVKIQFVSGLGQILGEAKINKEDMPLIKEFAVKSKFTDIICKDRLLSRDKLPKL